LAVGVSARIHPPPKPDVQEKRMKALVTIKKYFEMTNEQVINESKKLTADDRKELGQLA